MPPILKAIPEDFKVSEMVSSVWDLEGPYVIYCLEKTGFNTIDAIREISKLSRVPSRYFSYGGKKDRHAVTRQFIAIEGKKIADLRLEHVALTFQGYAQRPMGPDLIDGNRFEITIRHLTQDDQENLKRQLENVRQYGFVNYFDDQRFGSFDKEQGFLAEKILLGHFNGAAKIYLTSIYSGDPKSEKVRKKYFLEHWKQWDVCLKQAHSEFERFAFTEMKKGEKAFLNVLNRIEKEEMSMFFSAFQSFLWNQVVVECLKELLAGQLVSLDGAAGEYLFPRQTGEENFDYLRKLYIPTAAHNTRFHDPRCEKIYLRILETRGIKIPMFNKLKIRKAFFKTTDRALLVFPGEINSIWNQDDLYPGKLKCTLAFSLPRGSYATMLIKNLLLKAE